MHTDKFIKLLDFVTDSLGIFSFFLSQNILKILELSPFFKNRENQFSQDECVVHTVWVAPYGGY